MKGETYQTADLAATIAALIGTDGINPDDALAFRFIGLGDRTAWSFDGKGTPAELVIEYEQGSQPPEAAEYDARHLASSPPSMDTMADYFEFVGAREGASSGLAGVDYLLG